MRVSIPRPAATAALLAAATAVLWPSPALGLDALWPTDVNAQVHRLKNLAAPGAGADALRLQDLAVGSCLLKATGVNVPTFVCAAAGTDYQQPMTAADASILFPSVSSIRLRDVTGLSVMGRIGGSTGVAQDITATADGQFLQRLAGSLTWASTLPGASVTGTPNTVAYFNGSGVLNSLALAPEFALTTGTLSLTANGVTNAKLAQMPARSFKVNATNAPGTPGDLACTGAGQVPQDNGTALVCQHLSYASLSGSPPAITSLTGPVTAAGPGAAATTIQPNVVTNSNLAQAPALTIKANAANTIANVQDVACATAGTFLGNITGTTLACGTIGPTSTTGLVATWPVSTVRTFLWDPVNGSDANVGYSDGAGPYNPATLAKQTVAGVMTVVPRNMAARTFRLLIASGTYSNPDLDQIVGGLTGIGARSLIRGTSTNSTASATAFADDANDQVFVGAVTATNASPGGYNPVAGATTTSIPVRLAGGGSASFPGEPASPLMWRMRFDSTTSTVALRNVARTIIQVSGTTLIPDTAFPATPSTSDKLYIEMPGVVVPTMQLGGISVASSLASAIGSATGLQIVGVRSTGAAQIGQGSGIWSLTFVGTGGQTTINVANIRVGETYRDPPSGVTVTTGGGLRSESGSLGIEVMSGPAFVSNLCSVQGISLNISSNVIVDGVAGGGLFQFAGWVNGSGTGVVRPMRVIGPGDFAGVEINEVFGDGLNYTGSNVTVTNSGSFPAFGLLGVHVVVFMNSLATGSTGNNDVGLSLGNTQGSIVFLNNQPTVTGALGDVRLCDGTIVTWATAYAGIVDTCGNWIGNMSAYPLTTKRTALSVTGNSNTSAYHFGDIVAAAGSGGVLRESGSTLGFGNITEGAVTNLTTDLAGKQATGNYITALTGDGTATGPGSVPFTLHNIPNLTTMASSVIATEVTGTSTPAAGTVNIHADSSADTLWVTDSTGRVTTTARPFAGTAHNVLTTMSADGTFGHAQMSYSDISGSVPAITALTGDVTATGPGSATATLHNIPSATTQAAFINATGIATPTTPATGHGNIYYDLTSQNLGVISEAGTYKHGIQTDTGSANQFVTGVTDTGFVLKAQPTTGNLLGPSGGGNQCLQANNSGAVLGTGAPCGSGSGSITAVTATAPLTSSGGTAPNISLNASGVSAGTYVTPTITVDTTGRITAASFTSTYQTVESDGTPVAGEATLNFHAPMHAADNSSPFRTEITINDFVASGSSHARGIVPDPGSTAGSRRVLNESGAWLVPLVSATSLDTTPDYLINKIGSTTGSVAVTTFAGGPSGLEVNLNVDPTKTAQTYRDYFIDIPSLQPADTASRWLTTSSQTAAASGGTVEYANTTYVVGHVSYDMDIISSTGSASSMQCAATRNGTAVGGTTLTFTPGSTPPGVYSISSTSTGSSSVSDTYGVACQYNGNFVTGPFGATIAFTVHMALLP